MSGFTAIEGRVLGMGTVSGTDETPISLYEPTHAIRIFLENPVTVNNAPVYLTGVTSLNTTASGLVDIIGDGATSVSTLGNVITITSPFPSGFNAVLGAGGTTITSGTNTLLISSQIDKALIGAGGLTVVSGSNINTLSAKVADAIIGAGGTTVVSGAGQVQVSSQIDKALVGTDGITIVSGSNTVTVQGFRPEFVAASGFLQSQITAASSDVDSVNAVSGAVLVTGTQNVTTQTVGQTITITGPDLTPYATTAFVLSVADEIEPAIVGAGGTTVTSGTNSTLISSQIDKAVIGTGGITITSGTNQVQVNAPNIPAVVSANNLLVVTSGANTITLTPDTTPAFASVDAISGTFTSSLTISGIAVSAGPKVDSLNSLTGAITLAAGANITITPLGNTLTVASTAAGGGGGGNALIGTGGVTITSGTNTTQVSSQIDKALVGAGAATVISGANLNIISAGIPNALIGTGGTTIISGTNTTQISSQIDKAWAGAGGATVISGTSVNILSASVANALIGTGGTTVTSGTNTTQVSSQTDKAWVGAGGATVISGSNINILSSRISNAIIGAGGITVISGTSTTSISSAAAPSAILGIANNTVVVSGSNSITVSGMVTVISGVGYLVDTTRGSKSLSVSRQNYPFSFDGLADGTFLAAGAAVNADAGWVMPRNGTIVSYSAYFTTGPVGKSFEVRKNNSATTISTLSINPGAAFYDDQVNINVDKGDRLQVFVTTAGLGAQDPTFMIEIAWRLA